MDIVLNFRASADVVAKMDQAVISRRLENPSVTFTRGKLIREAVAAYLGDVSMAPVKTRTRARSNTAA